MNTTDITAFYVTSGRLIQKWNEEEFVTLIPSFILVLTVLCLGIPGNIITLLVYTTKMRRTASRIFILALAYCDLFNCCVTMPFEISIMVQFRSFDFPEICAGLHTFTYIMNGVAALLLCGIAVDRFRKICQPLKPVFTPKRVRSICLLSLCVGVAFYIPGFFLYGTRTVEKDSHGLKLTGKTCQISDDYKDSKLRMYIYSVWFLGTISVMFVLIVIYSMIGRAVFKRIKLEHKRERESLYMMPKPKQKLRRLAEEQSSETSCSFGGVIDTTKPTPKRKRKDRKVFKTISAPSKAQINKSLKKKFRQSAPTLQRDGTLLAERAPRRIHAGRTTVMLFSVTIAYVLSFVPFVVIVVIRAIKPTFYETLSDAEKSVWNLFLRSYVINCAVNPILYGLFNKDFRMKMVELLEKVCCC